MAENKDTKAKAAPAGMGYFMLPNHGNIIINGYKVTGKEPALDDGGKKYIKELEISLEDVNRFTPKQREQYFEVKSVKK